MLAYLSIRCSISRYCYCPEDFFTSTAACMPVDAAYVHTKFLCTVCAFIKSRQDCLKLQPLSPAEVIAASVRVMRHGCHLDTAVKGNVIVTAGAGQPNWTDIHQQLIWDYVQKKVYAARRHDGSLCTHKQPKTLYPGLHRNIHSGPRSVSVLGLG